MEELMRQKRRPRMQSTRPAIARPFLPPFMATIARTIPTAAIAVRIQLKAAPGVGLERLSIAQKEQVHPVQQKMMDTIPIMREMIPRAPPFFLGGI